MDTRGFRKVAEDLSDMSGTPVQEVILERAGHLLENCVRFTPTRTAEQIKVSVQFRNRNLWENSQQPRLRGDPIISITKKQVAWFVDESTYDGHGPAPQGRSIRGKTFHIMNDRYRWSDKRWAEFQAALSEMQQKRIDLTAAVRSRGVMARSWYQIAQALGIDIKVPNYVKNAVPMKGQLYVNGTAHKFLGPTGFFVELINNNPILIRRLGGASILSRAIQTIINQFEGDLARGVFDDLKRRAHRYRGIFVS